MSKSAMAVRTSLRAAQQTFQSAHDKVTLLYAQTSSIDDSIQAAASAPPTLGESTSHQTVSDRQLVRQHAYRSITETEAQDVTNQNRSQNSLSEAEVDALVGRFSLKALAAKTKKHEHSLSCRLGRFATGSSQSLGFSLRQLKIH